MRRTVSAFYTKKSIIGSYIRNFVFGVEDSLVSTVGLLSGIAATGSSRKIILLSGIVLIFVEAFSMGIGTVLSEQSEEEYLRHKDGPLKLALANGLIMFISYFVAGFIPLTPYMILQGTEAFWFSIIISILSLATLGVVGGRLFKVDMFRSGLKMAVLGGLAIVVGIIIGQFVTDIA